MCRGYWATWISGKAPPSSKSCKERGTKGLPAPAAIRQRASYEGALRGAVVVVITSVVSSSASVFERDTAGLAGGGKDKDKEAMARGNDAAQRLQQRGSMWGALPKNEGRRGNRATDRRGGST